MRKNGLAGSSKAVALFAFAWLLAFPPVALTADTAAHGAGRTWSFSGLAAPVKVASVKELGAVLTKSLAPGAPAATAAGVSTLNDVQLAAFIHNTADAAARLQGEVTVEWDAATGSLKLTSASGESVFVAAAAPERAVSSEQAAKISAIAASLRQMAAADDIGQTINQAFSAKEYFDPAEGAADLKSLQALNADMTRAPRTADQLRAQGITVDGSQTVTRQSDERQKMKFRELLLPAAKTGMYAPTKQVPANQLERVILFMPGMGTTRSNAKTVLDVAGTFNNKKGTLAYALDITLNGMGEHMPFGFASPDGMVAVIDHAVKVLQALHPGKPVYLAGRSQGGLAAVEYASRNESAAGVVALGLSHPDMVQETIPLTMSDPELTFSPRAWAGFTTFTDQFKAAVAVSKVPVLLLLNEKDSGYPQPMYFQAWKKWVADQPALRTLRTFVAGAEYHDFWLRDARKNPAYDAAIEAMVRFFESAAPSAPKVVAAGSPEAPAAQAKTVAAADLAARVKPDFSRKLKTITIETDEFDASKVDALIAEAKRLGVNELIIQDPNKSQAETMRAKGAFPTVDWVHWKRDAVGVEEYIQSFTNGDNKRAMRSRMEAGKDVKYVVNKFNADDYAKIWKIWKQEIGSRPDALQFEPGVDIWPQDFAEKLLAGKDSDPTHGVADDWITITAIVDGKVAGGMVGQKRWDRGFLHGRMGAYLPEYVGRKDRTPAGMTPKNYFIEFNLSLRLMEEARKAGLQASKGTDTGEPGYGTDLMLMHSKFDEMYEVVPEAHTIMRLVLTPGPNDYIIPTLDMDGPFAKRYFAERAAGRKPLGRDVIGSFATKNGWLTTKPDVIEAFYKKQPVSLSYETIHNVATAKDVLIGRRNLAAVTDGTGKAVVEAGQPITAEQAALLKDSKLKSLKLYVDGEGRVERARAMLAGKISADAHAGVVAAGETITDESAAALARAGLTSVNIRVGKPGAEVVTKIELWQETIKSPGDKAVSLVGRRPVDSAKDGTGAVLVPANTTMTAKDVSKLVQAGVSSIQVDVDASARAARAKELLFNRVLAADVFGKNGKPVARARQVLSEDLIAKIVAVDPADVQVYIGNPALDRVWGPFLHFTNGDFKPKVPRSLQLEQRPIARENGA